MASEFELIARHFRRPTAHTVLGVGDDAALIAPRLGCELAISTDTLAAGTHFFPDAEPEALGWKTLAVNLSDLAAMGAQPRWALLAAALPEADETWIAAFARGFFGCAEAFGVDVIGGDTTRGALTLTPTVIGEVPAGQALRRSGARAGDELWVSGTPGCAGLGLAHLRGRIALPEPLRGDCLKALHRPQPRVALGLALRALASACIDVSDGLAADIGHILEESGLAGRLDAALLPRPAARPAGCDELQYILAGGDDYELAFAAAPERRADLAAAAGRLGLALTRIGRAQSGPAGRLDIIDRQGRPLALPRRGYDHFA